MLGLRSRSHVSLLERGIRAPTVEHLLVLEAVFKLTARDLFPSLHARAKERTTTVCNEIYREVKDCTTPREKSISKHLQSVLVEVALAEVISPGTP